MSLQKNLIVVGNGQILRPQGHLINEADTVIRLSTYQIEGCEHLVGTKTDIVSVARLEKLDPMPNKVWFGNKYGLSSYPIPIIERTFPTHCITVPPPDFAYIYSKYKMHPTLGSLTIWLAYLWGRAFYDNIFITGFGFSHKGRPRTYWNDDPVTQRVLDAAIGHHDYSNERAVLKDMIAKGYIDLLDVRDAILLEDEFSLSDEYAKSIEFGRDTDTF